MSEVNSHAGEAIIMLVNHIISTKNVVAENIIKTRCTPSGLNDECVSFVIHFDFMNL